MLSKSGSLFSLVAAFAIISELRGLILYQRHEEGRRIAHAVNMGLIVVAPISRVEGLSERRRRIMVLTLYQPLAALLWPAVACCSASVAL